MSYEIAVNKAWDDILKLGPEKNISVRFLSDTYSIDTENKKVFSVSCNVPAKNFIAILILHYLAKQLISLPAVTGEWLTFRELSGIEGYYPAFKKRAIEPVIRKYGNNPQGLYSVLERLAAKKAEGGDAAVIIEGFEGVPALIKVWRKDAEFGTDANIYFDRSIVQIFCIEDIVVLAGLIAEAL